jgi:hypothetical protein
VPVTGYFQPVTKAVGRLPAVFTALESSSGGQWGLWHSFFRITLRYTYLSKRDFLSYVDEKTIRIALDNIGCYSLLNWVPWINLDYIRIGVRVKTIFVCHFYGLFCRTCGGYEVGL